MKKLITLIITFAVYISCTSTPAIKHTTESSSARSIAVLEKVNLGGLDQWISIRGQDADKPILLYLHGGPGSAEMPMVRHYNNGLEKDFIMVVWDQRGAGKSFSSSIPKESMNIAQFISDTHELTTLLKDRFGKNKIFIMGHSWGSLLGMFVINKYPDDYFAYIGIGQYVNGTENELVSYNFALSEAEKRGDKSAIEDLREIGPPVNGLYAGDWFQGLLIQRKYLGKFGGQIYNTDNVEFFKVTMFSPEYSLFDNIFYVRGIMFSVKSMGPEIVACNLETQVPSVKIPVFFFCGRYDYSTPLEIVERYCKNIDAPKKKIIYFENSAHMMNFEEPDLFMEMVREKFLLLVE